MATAGHQMEDTSTYAVAEEAANDPEDDAVVKGITGSFSRDANETGFEGVTFSSSSVLDLSQRGLCHLGDFFKIPNLKVSAGFLGGCGTEMPAARNRVSTELLSFLSGEVNSSRSRRVNWGFIG